ncbi:MAG: hypothetical protein CL868_07645 [Cytophagaceae bacterium]|nr:hypothetical protein [Cytophagaceae bacterium]|tara:strand:+ start:12167 stop:12745 length:579 start_codon:yes stop_codon:yes gene_type:complete
MKNFIYVLPLVLCAFVSCDKDESAVPEEMQTANFTVSDFTASELETTTKSAEAEHCFTTRLLAGQHIDVGFVAIDYVDNTWVLTYETKDGWSINATHLSIGDCEDKTFPTTNSGNPKVGKFEHSSTHRNGVVEVVYVLDDVDILDYIYCFAAHAEVKGPGGKETAWAEGEDFGGKSWAMFVKANLFQCYPQA